MLEAQKGTEMLEKGRRWLYDFWGLCGLLLSLPQVFAFMGEVPWLMVFAFPECHSLEHNVSS